MIANAWDSRPDDFQVGRIGLPPMPVLPLIPLQTPPEALQGVKHDHDKPKYSLLPKGVLAAVVRVLTFGAKKYAPDNWMKLEPDRYYDALWRHVEAKRNGETYDPETKEHHYAHAICCLMFMWWLDLNKPKTNP